MYTEKESMVITEEAIEVFKRVAKENMVEFEWRGFLHTYPKLARTILLAMVEYRLNSKTAPVSVPTPEESLVLWKQVHRIFVRGSDDRNWEDLQQELSRFVILKNV